MANVALAMPAALYPLLIISGDRYAANLRSIQKTCLMVAMDRPSTSEIRARVRKICDAERIQLPDAGIDAIAATRDVRQTILQLQLTEAPSAADERLSPFHVTHRLFARTGRLLMEAMQPDRDLVSLMVQDNYLQHSKTLEDAADAAAHLSDADLQAHGSAPGADAGVLLAVAASTRHRAPGKRSGGFPTFPQILGKTSAIAKRVRLQREVQRGMATMTLDPYTCQALLSMLGAMSQHGQAKDAAKLVASYGMDKEAVEKLANVCTLKKSELCGASKSAFTRELTKLSKPAKPTIDAAFSGMRLA
jgi:hypothetical protein